MGARSREKSCVDRFSPSGIDGPLAAAGAIRSVLGSRLRGQPFVIRRPGWSYGIPPGSFPRITPVTSWLARSGCIRRDGRRSVARIRADCFASFLDHRGRAAPVSRSSTAYRLHPRAELGGVCGGDLSRFPGRRLDDRGPSGERPAEQFRTSCCQAVMGETWGNTQAADGSKATFISTLAVVNDRRRHSAIIEGSGAVVKEIAASIRFSR